MNVVPIKTKSYDVPQSADFGHRAVSHASASTDDGSSVVMTLGGSQYQLKPRQADTIAQGLLMAVLRTDLEIASTPWDRARVMNVSSCADEGRALQFWDDTSYGADATFRFFGACWTYEGDGEDPDYPANALCIRTFHYGGILFGKGNVDYLLTADQAYQLCHSLSSCAYLLETRSWKIWDKVIVWRAHSSVDAADQTQDNGDLLNYLKSYELHSSS